MQAVVPAANPLPLLVVCETARGRRNSQAEARGLSLLTTTLERALASPVTFWRGNGLPSTLHRGD